MYLSHPPQLNVQTLFSSCSSTLTASTVFNMATISAAPSFLLVVQLDLQFDALLHFQGLPHGEGLTFDLVNAEISCPSEQKIYVFGLTEYPYHLRLPTQL